MELQPFAAVTCQGCGSRRARGVLARACACISATSPPLFLFFLFVFFRVRHLLGPYLCSRGTGMRGMQAPGLPVYSEGFLQCGAPPLQPGCLPGFLSKIFHIFAPVVLGTGQGPGTREPPVAFLNSFLQHRPALSYSPAGIFFPPQSPTV